MPTEQNRISWSNLSPRAKLLFVITLGVLIFIVVPLIAFIGNRVNSATVTLTYAPKSAQAKIDGRSAKFGENRIAPGTYEVTIEKKGFETYKEKITVAADGEVEVAYALLSNDPSTARWYQENIEDYSIAQSINDSRADKKQKNMLTDYPIITDLPIIGLYSRYRVDYGVSPSNDNKFAIFINYKTEQDKQTAINIVDSMGYDLRKYEVIYTQSEPEAVDSITFNNLDALRERGLGATAAYITKDALVARYRGDQPPVTIIAVSSNVAHWISDDKTTDTYRVTLRLNDSFERELTIAIINNNTLRIEVSLPGGTGREVLYDGPNGLVNE